LKTALSFSDDALRRTLLRLDSWEPSFVDSSLDFISRSGRWNVEIKSGENKLDKLELLLSSAVRENDENNPDFGGILQLMRSRSLAGAHDGRHVTRLLLRLQQINRELADGIYDDATHEQRLSICKTLEDAADAFRQHLIKSSRHTTAGSEEVQQPPVT
jgi:hypothetical protein